MPIYPKGTKLECKNCRHQGSPQSNREHWCLVWDHAVPKGAAQACLDNSFAEGFKNPDGSPREPGWSCYEEKLQVPDKPLHTWRVSVSEWAWVCSDCGAVVPCEDVYKHWGKATEPSGWDDSLRSRVLDWLWSKRNGK